MSDAMNTLRQVARLIELAYQEGEIEEWTERLYDAYERVRDVLGEPIKTYPGGEGGEHIHFLDQDACETCEEWEVARAEGLVPRSVRVSRV